jgi:hypothetical protein
VDANHQVVHYLVTEALKNPFPEIIFAVTNNQYLPVDFWLKIAKEGTSQMLDRLLQNKNKLVAYPEIMNVMEKNPGLTDEIQKKIITIKESYLKGLESFIIPREAVIVDVPKELQKVDSDTVSDHEPVNLSDIKKEVKSTLKRINQMTVRERIKLAFTGNRSERLILAKDRNKYVHLSLVEGPRIDEAEIVRLLQSKNLEPEVVSGISKNRYWLISYPIVLSLVRHPRVPVKRASVFIKRLKPEDLKELMNDKNINPDLRKQAEACFKK